MHRVLCCTHNKNVYVLRISPAVRKGLRVLLCKEKHFVLNTLSVQGSERPNYTIHVEVHRGI